MAYGKYSKAYLVGGFAALGGFIFGYHTGVISGVLTMNNFKDMMKMNTTEHNNTCEEDSFDSDTGYIIGTLLIGCFLGSLIGGRTSDWFSRKYSISAFSLLFTITAAVQTFVPQRNVFLIGQFFSGLTIGALSMIVPVYHSEISATKVRGRVITFQQWAITIGIGVSFWINYGASPMWQIPVGLQMVPSIILAVGIIFCPFSPRWLLFHDREDEAREVLMKIRSASHDEIEEELDRIKNEVAYLRENEIESFRQLFHFPLLRPFLLGIGIQILQQLTGINVIIYYAPKIFEQIFGNPMNDYNSTSPVIPLLATGTYGTVNVLFTIPTMIFIDKLGRRFLLITGAIIMSISMLIVSILTYVYELQENNSDSSCNSYKNQNTLAWMIIIFIHVFIAGFAFSWGPVAWVYCAELFPLTIRAKATSLTTAANWITNLITSIVALLLLSHHHYAAFLTFAILCALMIAIVYFFYPETKSMHLEEHDIVTNNRVFVPQWAETRRRNYNTFSQQGQQNGNQTGGPTAVEQNLRNESNQININSSNRIDQNDQLFPQKVID